MSTWARWVRWRLNPYRQIDRLVARERGAGTAETAPFRLPHARYTVFNDYDPAEAVESFAIVEMRGRRWPDWAEIPAPVGMVTAPLVQEELPAGAVSRRDGHHDADVRVGRAGGAELDAGVADGARRRGVRRPRSPR